MMIVLWLLAIQGLVGAFGTFYFHEWRAKLPGRGLAAASELRLHAARDFFYALLFATLPWVAWHGWHRPADWMAWCAARARSRWCGVPVAETSWW